MKKKLFVLILFFFNISMLNAQSSYSCNYREYCDWNSLTQKYEQCEGYAESSLFVMNKLETLFTHTLESIKSTYYVESKSYDSKNDVYTYNVVSDVGNKYYYIFDPKNKEVRAVFSTDNKVKMIRFKVKAIF